MQYMNSYKHIANLLNVAKCVITAFRLATRPEREREREREREIFSFNMDTKVKFVSIT